MNRYNRIISKAASELDDLISTGSALAEANLDILGEVFEDDRYIDWQKKTDGPKRSTEELFTEAEEKGSQIAIEGALDFAKKYFTTRKG